MAGQDSNDRIAELIKQACPPAAASPEFKARLRQQLNQQGGASGPQGPRPLWQQPFLWISAAAMLVIATALIVYFAAFSSIPPAVSTGDATAIQTTAATLNGTLDSLGSADNVTVSFEYGTAPGSYPHTTADQTRTSTSAFSADLSGLTPDSTYYYRAKADGDGTPVYGKEKSFATPSTAPSVTTSDATSVTITSATLNGDLTSLGTADNVTVSFEWGTATGSYAHTTADRVRTSTGAFSADLSGLTPGTTYYYRAKADSGSTPVYGKEKSFVTPATGPSVTTNDATSVTITSATLNGDLTSLGTAGSVTVGFEWGTASGSYAHTTADQARTSTGAFSADLSGLTPGVTYYYRAKADGDGATVYGAEKSFTTPSAPPVVRTSSATNVRCTSATLNGILESLGTAASVGVSFEWGTTEAYGNQTASQVLTATGSFSATLTGLSENTTYHFRAKATGHGTAYGADMAFTTGPMRPPQKTWYLSDNGSTTKVMYEGDVSKPTGIVTLYSSGSVSSQVWTADQPSLTDTVYPADNWSVSLHLSHMKSGHTVYVEIGTWDGAKFVPYGSCVFRGEGDDNSVVYEYDDNISVSSFNVPDGSYVATKVTAPAGQMVYVHVGGSQSYVQSPLYPETTAPTVMTSAATSVTQTTATMNGYLDSLGTAGGVIVYFEWGMSNNYGTEIKVDTITSPGSFSLDLTDLAPNTTYHFRAKAVGDGTNYDVDITFTTAS